MKFKMYKYKNYFHRILILLVMVFAISCGDDIPTDYVPQNFVEGVLLVGEPIRDIKIIRTQPINAIYNYYKSHITDAEAIISGDGREFLLSFNFDTLRPGYFATDSNYFIKPNTFYSLEVRLKDGSVLTGETTTPLVSDWKMSPKNFIQYPLDTLKLSARDTIAWQKVAGYDYYMIAVVCLDTLEYGKYLASPREEKNRRTYKPFSGQNTYKDLSSTSFLPNNETSVVWTTFKWFGKHEVVVYTPDWNFTRWFVQNVSSSSLNPLYSSIEGGVGVFGSASVLRDTSVLLKNQP